MTADIQMYLCRSKQKGCVSMALSHKEMVFTVNAAPDQVYAAICQAMAAVNGFNEKRKADADRKVLMSTGVSFSSWGEEIVVQVSGYGESAQVQIQSSSKFGIAGYLNHQKNIDKIYAALYPALQALSAAPAEPAANGAWVCSCGRQNTGNFCSSCGQPKQ